MYPKQDTCGTEIYGQSAGWIFPLDALLATSICSKKFGMELTLMYL
jgi:hypothetical protein